MHKILLLLVIAVALAGCGAGGGEPSATEREEPAAPAEPAGGAEPAAEADPAAEPAPAGPAPAAEPAPATDAPPADVDPVDGAGAVLDHADDDLPWTEIDAAERYEVAHLALREEESFIEGLEYVTDEEAEDVAVEVCGFYDEGHTTEDILEGLADGFAESPAFGDTTFSNRLGAAGAFLAFSMILECPEYEADLDAALAAMDG